MFYYGSGSPFAWRVWLALDTRIAYEAKRLSFDKHETRTPEFLALNPRGKVPTIVHDGWPLRESSVILEYLEEAWPAPRAAVGAAGPRPSTADRPRGRRDLAAGAQSARRSRPCSSPRATATPRRSRPRARTLPPSWIGSRPGLRGTGSSARSRWPISRSIRRCGCCAGSASACHSTRPTISWARACAPGWVGSRRCPTTKDLPAALEKLRPLQGCGCIGAASYSKDKYMYRS